MVFFNQEIFIRFPHGQVRSMYIAGDGAETERLFIFIFRAFRAYQDGNQPSLNEKKEEDSFSHTQHTFLYNNDNNCGKKDKT